MPGATACLLAATIGVDINFNLAHLKAIHKHLFQDIYSWAGQIRSYPIKIDIDIFTPPDQVEYYANQIAQEIRDDHYLIGLDRESVVLKIARYLGLIGMLHPFPDGNGRTQRAFLRQLALNAGYSLNWELVHSWENMLTAQNVHRHADYSGMERMLCAWPEFHSNNFKLTNYVDDVYFEYGHHRNLCLLPKNQ